MRLSARRQRKSTYDPTKISREAASRPKSEALVDDNVKNPLQTWADLSLEGKDRSYGIEFYELLGALTTKKGRPLVVAACALLDEVRKAIVKKGRNPEHVVPYVKLRLPSTDMLLSWSAELGAKLSGESAAVEIVNDGCVFYWGVWESHHETISIVDDPKYRAIFRRHKGFYNSRPWDRYETKC